MIVKCNDCQRYYNDEFRDTYCPHKVFLANDGKNNFEYHYDSFISDYPPTIDELAKARKDQLC